MLRKMMRQRALPALFAIALLGPGTAVGATINSRWNGGSGNWSTAADWAPNTVPNNGNGNTYDVTIASGYSGGDLVLLDTGPTVASLTVGVVTGIPPAGGSQLYDQSSNPQTLTILGPLTINVDSSLFLDSSTVNVGANSINNGFLAVRGSAALTVSGNLANGRALIAGGDMSHLGTLNVTGTLNNEPNQTFDVSGTANVGTLVNSGFTHVDSGGRLNANSIANSFPASANLIVDANGMVNSTTFANAQGTNLGLASSSGSTPGGVLDTAAFTSGGVTSLFPGATITVGSGTVPSGTTGYYEFGNGTLDELLYGLPGSNNTCNGTFAADDCGIINVYGDVTLSGTLDPILENGFDPMNGDSFIFLTFDGTLNGQFSSIADQYFNNDMQQWAVTYGSDFVELTAEAYSAPPVSGVPEPATPALFGSGLMALSLLAWFKRRSSHSSWLWKASRPDCAK